MATEACDDHHVRNGTSDSCCDASCQLRPAGSACGDGLFCTLGDVCDDGGTCIGGPDDPCVGGDVCSNVCNETGTMCFNPPTTPCADGLFCTAVDRCDGAGACAGASDPSEDGPPCADTCNEAARDCLNPALSPCGDDSERSCGLPDTCDGLGRCQSNRLDRVPCTPDGVFCDGPEYCFDGACLSVGLACNPETSECDEQAAACVDFCGDGMLEDETEACDDGNDEPGDGCDEECEVEAGWECEATEPESDDEAVMSRCIAICGDSLVVAAEVCDDGNSAPADGCFECVIEDSWVGGKRSLWGGFPPLELPRGRLRAPLVTVYARFLVTAHTYGLLWRGSVINASQYRHIAPKSDKLDCSSSRRAAIGTPSYSSAPSQSSFERMFSTRQFVSVRTASSYHGCWTGVRRSPMHASGGCEDGGSKASNTTVKSGSCGWLSGTDVAGMCGLSPRLAPSDPASVGDRY